MQNFTEIQALMKSELDLMNKILVDRLDSNVDLINQMSHYIITVSYTHLTLPTKA